MGQAPPLPTLAPQAVGASLELAAVRRQAVKLFLVLKGEPHPLRMRPQQRLLPLSCGRLDWRLYLWWIAT